MPNPEKAGQRRRGGAGALAVAAFLIAIGFAVWGLRGIRLENRIEDWLSQDDVQARVLSWFRAQFPDDEQIIVSWTDASEDDPRLSKFAAALNANRGSLTFEVITPESLIEEMQDGKVDEADALSRIEGSLVGPPVKDNSGAAARRPAGVLVRFPRGNDVAAAELIGVVKRSAVSAGVPEESLLLGGSCVTSEALNREVVRSVWDADAPIYLKSVFGLSALTGVVLTLFLLRDVLLSGVVVFAAYATSLIATSLVPWTGREMNMVLVVMPSLVLVLTLSAAIHVANYWRHAIARGSATPARVAVRKALVPCFLAALTTVIGLTSLAISSLHPIRDFGVFAAIGVAISLAIVLLVLPQLLPRSRSKSQLAKPTAERFWDGFGRWILNRRHLLAGLGLVLFVATTSGLSRFQTDTRVGRYFPADSKLSRDYRTLEKNIGGLDSLEIVVRFNAAAQEASPFFERMELVRRIESHVQKHPAVSGAMSLADFQPVTVRPPADAGFLKKGAYHRRSNETERRMKNELRDEVSNFMIVRGAPSDVKLPQRFGPDRKGDELWRITAQAYVMSGDDYGVLLRELDESVAAATGEEQGVSHLLTGTVPLFMRTQEILLQSMKTSLWITFVVIAVVMSILLKSARAGLLAMVPNLLPIGMVFGAMSWCGEVIDIGTMLTGAIALGISVDGTLHVLTWFRSALQSGASPREAVLHALRSCGPALVQTNSVVGVSLLMLFPASLLLISRFGWVMATMLGAALAANVVILPVLLSGRLGALMQKAPVPRDRPEPEGDDLDAENRQVA